MRRKAPPTRAVPGPAKRRRTATAHPTAAEAGPSSRAVDTPLARWALAEWFVPLIDAPFFAHSEFRTVLTTIMDLATLTQRATRLQLSLVRAAMCNAIPGRFASPRRLSAAFLAAEVQELCMYRADARRVLRGCRLDPATDPTSGAALPRHWWSRHRNPPPEIPPVDAPVVVCIASQLVFAHFVAFHDDATVRVRLADSKAEKTVSDLDVMMLSDPPEGVPPPPPPPQPAQLPLQQQHTQFQQQQSSNLTIHQHQQQAQQNAHLFGPFPGAESPVSSRLAFSPGSLFDPLSFEPTRIDAPSPHLTSASPRHLDFSPQRSAALVTTAGLTTPTPARVPGLSSPAFPASNPHDSDVVCEVDIRQLAESMRLLEHKSDALTALRALNDECAAIQPVDPSQPFSPPPQMQARFEVITRDLEAIRDDLRLAGPSGALTPLAHRSSPFFNNLQQHLDSHTAPTTPELSAQRPMFPPPTGVTSTYPGYPGMLPPNAIGSSSAAAFNTPNSRTTASVGTTVLPVAGADNGIGSSTAASSATVAAAAAVAGYNGHAVIPPRGIDGLSAQHHHINAAHPRSARGAARLGRAATYAALGRLSDPALMSLPEDLRKDVVELVASCVSVLARARATQDPACVAHAIDAIPVRLPANAEALDAIHAAARSFEMPGVAERDPV